MEGGRGARGFTYLCSCLREGTGGAAVGESGKGKGEPLPHAREGGDRGGCGRQGKMDKADEEE